MAGKAWLLLTAALTIADASAAAPRATIARGVSLESLRTEINTLERDLLTSRESQISAANQLKKIRKLLTLQQKEIQLSKKRVGELATSLTDLSSQKQALLLNIEKQKASLKVRLRELSKMTETAPLDAGWLRGIEQENQKTYFLSKTLKKDLASVDRLRNDVLQAQGLELRILEEKNKLDYYVQELESDTVILGANLDVQKEILRTNRSNRLESMRRMRELKESEQELESVLTSYRKGPEAVAAVKKTPPSLPAPALPKPAPIDARAELKTTGEVTLVALKGKLPFPVSGQVLSAFGKSYNPKTNLLTFQKGITLGAAAAAEVKAVSSGKVVFAGPLKNYGTIAIVEHPGQYYTLYGQMGSVAVAEGATVRQGEVLGKTAGEPLYFEIRNKNVAVNPLQWLSSASITLSKQ